MVTSMSFIFGYASLIPRLSYVEKEPGSEATAMHDNLVVVNMQNSDIYSVNSESSQRGMSKEI